MAFSNSGSTYNTNALPGFLQGIGQASIYDVDANAKFAVGSGFKRADGNIYRYCNFITATTQGLLVSHVVADVDTKYSQPPIIAGSSATQQPTEQVGVYPGAIGSKYVLTTGSSTVKDQWAGGYLVINSTAGTGYTYRIKGNTAVATINGVANTVIIELYEPLVVALTASSYVSIIGSLYSDVKASTAATDYISIGVTQANMTANTYGWVCTHGVTGVLVDGTMTIGCMAQKSLVTAGAVAQYGVGTTSNASNTLFVSQPLGWCIDPATSTAYGVIYLQVE